MWKSLFRFHILLLFIFSSVSSISSKKVHVDGIPCHPHQIQAFTRFKNEFDTSHCNHNDSSNGVRCDKSTGAVIKLQITECLSGILKSNSSLFKFHHLRHLNISHNNFISSSLPFEFGNLNRLEVLSLPYNGFLGQVPSSLNNLSLLSYVDLSRNRITGSFPLLWNLTKLIVLDISYNHFSGMLNPSYGLFELNHLRYLDLGFNNFSSSLPSQFGNLYRLENLYLTSNGFLGQVPSTVSNLSKLIELRLGINKFSGSFPLVQNLTKLSLLGLQQNNFTGTVPSSLFAMPFLSFLNLRENHLTGSIKVFNLSTSSSIKFLYLGNNLFEGQILEPISKLITLIHLDLSFLNTSYPINLRHFSSMKSLSYLELSGNNIYATNLSSNSYIPLSLKSLFMANCGICEFPSILKTLQNLEHIILAGNEIKGKVPRWLWNLPRLEVMDITQNSFNGFEGPVEGLVNSSLIALFWDENNFEGALPPLPQFVNVLSAAGNSFTGEIHVSICSHNSLSKMDLSYNNFTGMLPQCLSNFMAVNLRKNNFEGSIPDEFYVDASLQTLTLDYNLLSGKLPKSLLNCSSLKFFSVENNRIEDKFPFWLKALPNLQVLILSSNKFYGPISPSHQGPLEFPELRILEISDNKFCGSLPTSYFVNWKSSSPTINEDGGLYMAYTDSPYDGIILAYMDHIDLKYKGLNLDQAKVFTFYSALDFSGNKFEGRIPESIGLLKGLIALNLSNNAFKDHIPLSFSNLTSLESLDLSRNQLSGTIPKGLGTISFLAYVNVSHNKLVGEIPQGTQITGQPKSCFEGNAGLCGLPLEESCLKTNLPPTQQHEEQDKEEEQLFNWKAVVVGYGPGLILGIAIAQVIASCKREWAVKIFGLINF